MNYIYENLVWSLAIELGVDSETISVSLKYTFNNQSHDDNFYYSFLPRIQVIPKRLLKDGNNLVSIESRLYQPEIFEKSIFSYRQSAEGIDDGSDCLMPIPWLPADGYIPSKTSLDLTFHWIEQGPRISQINRSSENWEMQHCLAMSKLFLPLKFAGRSSEIYDFISAEEIKWTFVFPEDVAIQNISKLSLNPDYQVQPILSHQAGMPQTIHLSLNPKSSQIRGACFKDHRLQLLVDLNVPTAIPKRAISSAERRLREYTTEVGVAVVDLRGSSTKAEEQRNSPDPSEYTSRFQQLAQDAFPFKLYKAEPIHLLMKKVPGDMVMLVAPAERTPELVEAVLKFLEKLSAEHFKFRAGFHVDQATDTGKFMNSLDDFGTDFLGPAMNYAAKIGDDKRNEGVRITKAAKDLIPLLEKRYNFVEVEAPEKVPCSKVYELKAKTMVVSDGVSSSRHFVDRLFDKMLKLNSRVCVGLDPELWKFPRRLLEKYDLRITSDQELDAYSFERATNCIIEFNKMVIDAVCDYAAAIKPQSAHYERFGYYGIRALYETVKYAKERGAIVILDAKRNDIGSTAEKYARAYIGVDKGAGCAAIPFDALTVNPYLGSDGIRPFVDYCSKNGKGIFVLVKTSNKSSSEIQDLRLREDDLAIAQKVALLVKQWGDDVIGDSGYSAVGAVVGATHPRDISTLRETMPQSTFLMPGYGAQGGKAENVVDAFGPNGLGALISSSRGVLYPCSPDTEDFQQEIEKQVRIMRDDINRIISRKVDS